MHYKTILSAVALLAAAGECTPINEMRNSSSTSAADKAFAKRVMEGIFAKLNASQPVIGPRHWALQELPNINDCETSTFIDQTSLASPSVESCSRIKEHIGIDHTYINWGRIQRRLVEHEECAFGAEGVMKHPSSFGATIRIGSRDVYDVIEESIRRFGHLHNGRIGAKGNMNCQCITLGQCSVDWGIYTMTPAGMSDDEWAQRERTRMYGQGG